MLEAGEEDRLFLGKKERRRSSAHKLFQGDYLGLSKNITVLKLLARSGDLPQINFADCVLKINKRFRMQERALMISETSLYNLDPHHYKIKRRIFIKNIGSISSSCLSDNFFILHIPTEYDYVFISNRKTEIIVKLMGLYERLTGKPLPINIDNRIEYKGDKASSSPSFVINFNKSEGGVNTFVVNKQSKAVAYRSGLPTTL